MDDIIKDIRKTVSRLSGEMENFQEIARQIKPPSGEVPTLEGIDVYGETIPLNGVVGGDHIIYVDYKQRYDLDARAEEARKKRLIDVSERLESSRQMAGVALLDVAGHQITDAMLAGMVHQAFLMGAIYEMDQFGTITERLFENLNTRIYKSSTTSKFLTMIYGEISESGRFRFVSAAHPMPVVFSSLENRIVDIDQNLFTRFPPIGTLPSEHDIDRSAVRSVLGYKERYEVNDLTLMGSGDILLLYSDGLMEHTNGRECYFPERLEEKLRKIKEAASREIFEALKKDVLGFAEPEDDISFVVIKRS